LVLYGLEATGKSAIVQAVLEALASTSGTALDGHAGEDTDEEIVQFAIVKSAESITGRHLLEQTVGSVAKAVDWKGKIGRCESLAQFVVELGRILNNHGPNAISDAKQRFVLVFDGIDSQREPPPTLLPALARLGEMVSGSPSKATISVLIDDLDFKPHDRFHSDSPAPKLPTFSRHSTYPFPSIHQARASTNSLPYHSIPKNSRRR
jgi:origin recognition complex subunit 5